MEVRVGPLEMISTIILELTSTNIPLFTASGTHAASK
jgi:hypothetical protein